MTARTSTSACAAHPRTAMLSKPYDIAQLQAAIKSVT